MTYSLHSYRAHRLLHQPGPRGARPDAQGSPRCRAAPSWTSGNRSSPPRRPSDPPASPTTLTLPTTRSTAWTTTLPTLTSPAPWTSPRAARRTRSAAYLLGAGEYRRGGSGTSPRRQPRSLTRRSLMSPFPSTASAPPCLRPASRCPRAPVVPSGISKLKNTRRQTFTVSQTLRFCNLPMPSYIDRGDSKTTSIVLLTTCFARLILSLKRNRNTSDRTPPPMCLSDVGGVGRRGHIASGRTRR